MQLNLFVPAGLSIRTKMKTLAELGEKWTSEKQKFTAGLIEYGYDND